MHVLMDQFMAVFIRQVCVCCIWHSQCAWVSTNNKHVSGSVVDVQHQIMFAYFTASNSFPLKWLFQKPANWEVKKHVSEGKAEHHYNQNKLIAEIMVT